jgi:hypothetical protein
LARSREARRAAGERRGANDSVTAHDKVGELGTEGRHRRALLDVWCAKADGTVAMIGTASALVAG